MYDYSFYIENALNMPLTAVITFNDGNNHFRPDTFAMAALCDTCVYIDQNWGTVRNIAAPSDSVAAYTAISQLSLYINDTLRYSQKPVDFSLWQHSGVQSGPGKSQYTFVVDTVLIP